MSIKRLNELPIASGVNLTPDDLFLVMDDPNGSSATKKVSLGTLAMALGSDINAGGNYNTRKLYSY